MRNRKRFSKRSFGRKYNSYRRRSQSRRPRQAKPYMTLGYRM